MVQQSRIQGRYNLGYKDGIKIHDTGMVEKYRIQGWYSNTGYRDSTTTQDIQGRFNNPGYRVGTTLLDTGTLQQSRIQNGITIQDTRMV